MVMMMVMQDRNSFWPLVQCGSVFDRAGAMWENIWWVLNTVHPRKQMGLEISYDAEDSVLFKNFLSEKHKMTCLSIPCRIW